MNNSGMAAVKRENGAMFSCKQYCPWCLWLVWEDLSWLEILFDEMAMDCFFFYCPGESLQPAGLRKHARDFCHFCFLFLCCFLTSCSLQHLYCPIVSSALCSPALPHTLSWLTCLIAYPFLLHGSHTSIWHKHDCCYNLLHLLSILFAHTNAHFGCRLWIPPRSQPSYQSPTNLLPIYAMSFKFGVL